MSRDSRHACLQLSTRVMRCLVDGNIDAAEEILSDPFINTGDICELLVQSRLGGNFYRLISGTALTRFFSVDELERLTASYQRQLEKCAKNITLQIAVGNCLDEASIPFLTIKGFYLAQRFFGDVRQRFMWDVDILVHDADFDAAILAVAPLGLQAPEGFKVNTRNHFWGIHAVEVRGPLGKLDIHRSIRVLPKIRFDYARMWSRSGNFRLETAEFRTLRDTDHLLTAAVGLGADVQTSHHNLRKIWDIYVMMRQLDANTDWETFTAERREEGSLKLVLNMLAFCLLLLGARDECPRLGRVLSSHSKLILINSEQQAGRIFFRRRQHIANRMLFSRLLPIPSVIYWLRWLVTLPVRLWHYRRPAPSGKSP